MNKLNKYVIAIIVSMFTAAIILQCPEGLAAGQNTADVGENNNLPENDLTKNAYSPEPLSLDEENAQILRTADGQVFQETIQRPDGKSIVLDAQVDVENVERVDCYQYENMIITDQQKTDLLYAFLGDRASEGEVVEFNGVFQHWQLTNSSDPNDYYKYSTTQFLAGEHVLPQEDIFMLEYAPRNLALNPFDYNLLPTVNESDMTTPMEKVIESCEALVATVSGQGQYAVDYVHAYGQDGCVPFYKVVFKQTKDGMTVTGYNDLIFRVDDDGIEDFYGPVYGIGESLLTDPILSVEQAVDVLKENVMQISFDEFGYFGSDGAFISLVDDELLVRSITLEYIVINQADWTAQVMPAWRFNEGRTDDEMNLFRDRVIAVNAVTGEIIQGRRNYNF